MVYTTYLWWFGGWFIIVLPTLVTWNQINKYRALNKGWVTGGSDGIRLITFCFPVIHHWWSLDHWGKSQLQVDWIILQKHLKKSIRASLPRDKGFESQWMGIFNHIYIYLGYPDIYLIKSLDGCRRCRRCHIVTTKCPWILPWNHKIYHNISRSRSPRRKFPRWTSWPRSICSRSSLKRCHPRSVPGRSWSLAPRMVHRGPGRAPGRRKPWMSIQVTKLIIYCEYVYIYMYMYMWLQVLP